MTSAGLLIKRSRETALLSIGLTALAAYTSRSLTAPGGKANAIRPEENRFTKVVLAEKLNEPLEMAVLSDI